MFYLLVWWLLLLLIGFAALPVTLRFLRFLPDRGYAFAKPLALLLWVYPFWLLTALGFLQNSFGVLAFLLVALAAASWGFLRGRGSDSVAIWLRENWRYALMVEGIFLVAYLGFAYFRAFNPEISNTEKPMEFMFLNSILQSPTFPPHDAWLSGFAISYYYLGYVIVAAIAKLGNIPSSYAFNLGLIMTFALTAVGAFGLVFNLVRCAQSRDSARASTRSRAPYVFGILAIFLLLIIGNLEGAFEAGYNAGIGSRDFYAALDLHGLEQVEPSGSFVPQDSWWWWRASRVVNDKTPNGDGHVEVIDEFPLFSFLLGDLHPHVLALPFGLLALAVAWNVMARPVVARESAEGDTENLVSTIAAKVVTPRMALTMLVVGALGMLNTWDVVTYGIIVAAAFALQQYRASGKATRAMLASSAAFLVALYIGAFLLFLPFYLYFSSQARGIAPNIFNRTPLHQYLIMFGLFIFVAASFAVVLLSQQANKRRALNEMAQFAVPLLAVPFAIALLGFIVLALNESLRNLLAGILNVAPQDAPMQVLGAFTRSFLLSPGTFLLLVVLIAAIAALGRLQLVSGETANPSQRAAVVFALLLLLIGLILTFGVEFLYIRDTFETRMNTVFKLYYQAWLLLAMAAAFGVFYIWQTVRGTGRIVWFGAFGVLFALSMVYPVLALPNRANYFKPDARAGVPTLDGWVWVRSAFPDDYAAIEWMRANVPRDAVILEAAGREYSFDDRVSVATGLPTVLGWGGHELQWRGNYDDAGPREKDVEQMYRSRDVNETRALLDKYGVDYVIVGSIERDKYQLNASLVNKFEKLGELVFEQGTMRVYRVGAPQ
jgi:YYY domain-containing protein